ncbi:hypothetical protein ABZP36_028767 [Zizania latifolia]
MSAQLRDSVPPPPPLPASRRASRRRSVTPSRRCHCFRAFDLSLHLKCVRLCGLPVLRRRQPEGLGWGKGVAAKGRISKEDAATICVEALDAIPQTTLIFEIRGANHLVIYSLPGRKEFYPELVNMLGESTNRKCTVFFSRLDLLKIRACLSSADAGMSVLDSLRNFGMRYDHPELYFLC